MYELGWKQFIPFVVTVLGIILTDLLTGLGLVLIVGIVIHSESRVIKTLISSTLKEKTLMTVK